MRAPLRLVWSEGMFMSPQHLQSLDRYHEDLLANRLESLVTYNWGTLDLEIDGAALGAGQIRIQRFAGVLPEGTPIAFEESDPAAPAPRPVVDHFPPTARSVEVYLAIPRERDGVPSYAQEGGEGRNRFSIDSRPVQDTTMVGVAVPVAFGRPNATLLFGDESREDYDSMMIAELVRGASGQAALSPNYVPPCLRVNASSYLMTGLRNILTTMIAKQRQLVEGRREREAAIEVTAPGVTQQLQLITLNGAIPGVAHLAETGEASPERVYLALVTLAGQLSTFKRAADPATLPKYQHTDLRATFEPLFAQLEVLLNLIAVQEYSVLPLELRGANLYLATVQDDRLLRNAQLILTVKSELPEQQIVDQLPKLCKIASSVDIQGLMHAVVSGIPVQMTYRPPPQIPNRQGTLYFVLTPQNDRYWQNVLVDRKLAVYLPAPFDPSRVKLELLSIPQTGSGPVQPPAPQPPRQPQPFDNKTDVNFRPPTPPTGNRGPVR
jgi:type VI secretion system protein ImpJ